MKHLFLILIISLACISVWAQNASDIEYHLSIEEPGIAIELLYQTDKDALGADYYRFYAAAKLMQGELLEAKAKLERGLEQFPDNHYLNQLQAEFYLQAGSTRQALELYEELKERSRYYDPELHSQVIGRLSNVYLTMGTQAAGRNQYQEAARWFQKVTQYRPDIIAGWYNLATVYYHLQRFDEALDSIERALIIDEDHEPSKELRFAVLAQLQRMDQIISLIEQEIEKNPENLELHLSKLRALMAGKKHAEADEYAERLMETFTREPNLYDELAAINRSMGHAEGQIAIIRKKRAAFPDKPEVLIELSELHEAMREWQTAAAKLDTLATISGFEEEAYVNKGRLLELQRLPGEAVAEYEAGLSMVPDSEKLYRRLGWVLMDLEEYDAAAKTWEKLYRLNREPEVLLNQAVSVENAYALEHALPIYAKLVETEYPYARALFVLARYHESASKVRPACELTARAVKNGYKEVLQRRSELGSHMEQLAASPQSQKEIDRRPEQLEKIRLLVHDAVDFVLQHCSENEADSILLALREKHGEQGEIIYFDAKKEFERKQYDEALNLVKRSISRMPELPEAHVLKARIFEQQENWREARQAWHRVHSLQPESDRAYQRLIAVYRETGELDELVRRWQPYHRTNPENEQLKKYLREVLYRLGRYDEAAGLNN